MGVSVYVMPLGTYLEGSFRTTWGPDGKGDAPRGPSRSPEESRVAVESFRRRLEDFVPRLSPWDESGPARSATTFSLDGFALPFQLAHQWAYRLPLRRLCALEPPQVWIPSEFEPTIRMKPPWAPEAEWTVASAAGIQSELVRLLLEIEGEERADLEEAFRVTERLIEAASTAVEHDAPVIVEA